MLCDGLEGGQGEKLKREVMNVYIWLIHTAVQQKQILHCKAIIFQFF